MMNAIKGARDGVPTNEEYPLSSAIWQVSAPYVPTADSLVAQTYEVIWKQIVEGERQPGERLIAGELARELGVSRTPVQQALYQLHQAGLVDAQGGRGFHVALVSTADIADLYDLRTILEVAAVHAAVEQIPSADLQAAREQITALEHGSGAEQSALFLQADVQLHHQLIAVYSGNRRLAEAIAHQRAHMSLFMVRGTRQPNGISMALREHAMIVQALLERDAAQAAAAMEQHIQRVKHDTLDHFASVRPARVRRFRAADGA